MSFKLHLKSNNNVFDLFYVQLDRNKISRECDPFRILIEFWTNLNFDIERRFKCICLK